MAKVKRKPAQEDDGFVSDKDSGFVADSDSESVADGEMPISEDDDGFISDSEEYTPPAPFESPKTLPSLDMQESAAKFAKAMSKKTAHGATLGTGDELLAGIQEGSFSSPEYVTKRDEYRKELSDIDQEYPIASPVAESVGSTLTTMAIPFLNSSRFARGVKDVGTAVIQGFGESPTMESAPAYAAGAGALQGGMELAGAGVRKIVADDPNKILSKSVGVRMTDTKAKDTPAYTEKYGKYLDTDEWRVFKEIVDDQPVDIGTDASIVRSISNLDNAGFFKQGKKFIDPVTRKFKRTKNSLEGFLKLQTPDDLSNAASDAINSLKARNAKLLENKKIDLVSIKGKIEGTIGDFTFDPSSHNAEAKYELAQDLKKVIYKDLKFYGSGDGRMIPASEVEMAKRRLDNYLKSPAFEKRTTDLGIDKQGAMKIRKAFDELLDNKNIGGDEYRKNNDMMHDLIRVKKVIDKKIDTSFVDTGRGMMDMRSLPQWFKETFISPTHMDIFRSDMAKGLDTAMGRLGSGVLQRTPVEAIVKDRTGRSPQSIGFTPKDVVNYKIPRDTNSIIQNKDIILAKMVQNGVPDEMVDTFSHALDEDKDAVSKIMPMVIQQFPTLFERSDYKVFDGKFLDPNDAAKAADSISKREDLNSIQRAKMINQINKHQSVPEGL